MSHESHSDTSTGKTHTKVSFSSSFWLVIILVFLFIGTLNFIQAVGGSHEEHAAGTEHAQGAGHEATHGDATHGEANHGEATHSEGATEKKEENTEEFTKQPKAEKTDIHPVPEHK